MQLLRKQTEKFKEKLQLKSKQIFFQSIQF